MAGVDKMFVNVSGVTVGTGSYGVGLSMLVAKVGDIFVPVECTDSGRLIQVSGANI